MSNFARESLGILGLALVGGGCWGQFGASAAAIVVGAMLLTFAIWGHIYAPVEPVREPGQLGEAESEPGNPE